MTVIDARGSKVKIARAEHHRKLLEESVNAFPRLKTYSFEIKPDPQHPKYALWAKQIVPVPDEWSLILGEFAHNARSSLDVLASQLCQLPVADPNRFFIQFPITANFNDFSEKAKRQLRGVPTVDVTEIERLQPYNSKCGFALDPIAILGDINNTDKHRLIPVLSVISKFDGLQMGPGPGAGNQLAPGITVKPGTEWPMTMKFGEGDSFVGLGGTLWKFIGSARVADGEAKVAEVQSSIPFNVRVKPEFSCHIEIGQGTLRSDGCKILATLALIVDRVKEIVRQFDPSAI